MSESNVNIAINVICLKRIVLYWINIISVVAIVFICCGDSGVSSDNGGDADRFLSRYSGKPYSDDVLITHTKSDVYHEGIGTESGGTVIFAVAQRFTSEQLRSLGVVGAQLTKVSFMPAEAQATYSIRVWIGGYKNANVFNPGTLVYSGAELSGSRLNLKKWNEITLTKSVTIPSNNELWIGYHINTQKGYPASTDAGPHLDGFGNLIFWDNEWGTLYQGNRDFPYNWMIRGFAEFNSSN